MTTTAQLKTEVRPPKCSDCGRVEVTHKVTLNGTSSFLCFDHYTALAKRIEQTVRKLGHGSPNVAAVVAFAVESIQIEPLVDVASKGELPAAADSRVLRA